MEHRAQSKMARTHSGGAELCARQIFLDGFDGNTNRASLVRGLHQRLSLFGKIESIYLSLNRGLNRLQATLRDGGF